MRFVCITQFNVLFQWHNPLTDDISNLLLFQITRETTHWMTLHIKYTNSLCFTCRRPIKHSSFAYQNFRKGMCADFDHRAQCFDVINLTISMFLPRICKMKCGSRSGLFFKVCYFIINLTVQVDQLCWEAAADSGFLKIFRGQRLCFRFVLHSHRPRRFAQRSLSF